MKLVAFKSTIMDQQGRIFLPAALRQRLGIREAGVLEFKIQRDGSAVMLKANEQGSS